MSLVQIAGLSIVEIIGDTSLKYFANNAGIEYLFVGIAGYIGVVLLLIASLEGSTLLIVNNGWDAISSLMESAFAYFVLGERFQSWYQYAGVGFIVIGLYLLKIPLKKSHPLYIPSMHSSMSTIKPPPSTK